MPHCQLCKQHSATSFRDCLTPEQFTYTTSRRLGSQHLPYMRSGLSRRRVLHCLFCVQHSAVPVLQRPPDA